MLASFPKCSLKSQNHPNLLLHLHHQVHSLVHPPHHCTSPLPHSHPHQHNNHNKLPHRVTLPHSPIPLPLSCNSIPSPPSAILLQSGPTFLVFKICNSDRTKSSLRVKEECQGWSERWLEMVRLETGSLMIVCSIGQHSFWKI